MWQSLKINKNIKKVNNPKDRLTFVALKHDDGLHHIKLKAT